MADGSGTDITDDKQARAAFSASVANVAFMLVLSRQMVDGLRLVRDGNGAAGFSAYLNPLVRRGLIVIERNGDIHSRNYFHTARLSRPGELAVRMLEEAGMLLPVSLAIAA